MPRLFASAAYRLAFTYTAACTLAILLLGSGVYLAAGTAIHQQQDDDLRLEMNVLTKEYEEGGRPDLIDKIHQRELSPNNDFRYALFASKQRLYGNLDVARPAAGFSSVTFPQPNKSSDDARGLLMGLPDGSAMLVAIDTEDLGRLDKTILILFSIGFVLILALGIVGSLALGRNLKLRLDRITKTAQAIADGDLTRRIERSGSADEFDQVDASLNAMLDRITSLLENLRQISSDVAHDLRTPLTRLRGEIEAGLSGPAEPDAMRGALLRALEQNDSILSLFAAILSIAEIESGKTVGSFRAIDLSQLVGTVCDMYAPALEDSGRPFSFSLIPDAVVQGDPELVMQAMSNLLDNALAHTPEGTRIHVTLARDQGGFSIHVADNGPGIEEADRERVVRRFVTLDRARSRGGHGLGLNLVSATMMVHGGKLDLGDNRPGLVVSLTFPDFSPCSSIRDKLPAQMPSTKCERKVLPLM